MVSLYSVAAGLAVDCVRQAQPAMVHALVDCLGEFVRKTLAPWLRRRGGWVRGSPRCREGVELVESLSACTGGLLGVGGGVRAGLPGLGLLLLPHSGADLSSAPSSPRASPAPNSRAKGLWPQSPCVAEVGLQMWAPRPMRGKILSLPRAPSPYPHPTTCRCQDGSARRGWCMSPTTTVSVPQLSTQPRPGLGGCWALGVGGQPPYRRSLFSPLSWVVGKGV